MPAHIAPEQVIFRPVLSEKSTYAMNEQKRYTFEVDNRATKDEIKEAIQTIYKVRVVGINTSIRQSPQRMLKFGKQDGKITKKAVIRLHKDDSIELF